MYRLLDGNSELSSQFNYYYITLQLNWFGDIVISFLDTVAEHFQVFFFYKLKCFRTVLLLPASTYTY